MVWRTAAARRWPAADLVKAVARAKATARMVGAQVLRTPVLARARLREEVQVGRLPTCNVTDVDDGDISSAIAVW